MEEENTPLVRSVGVIDENLNFIPYGSTAIENGVPVFVFDTKEEYDQHAPTLPEPCVVITLDDIDTGGFEFDSAIDPESENAVQNKVIAAALETLRDKATFERLGMVRFTDATTVTDQNSGYALSAIEKNASVEGSLANIINKKEIKVKTIDFTVVTQKDSAGIYFGETDLQNVSGFPSDYISIIPQYAQQESWSHTLSVFGVFGTLFCVMSVDATMSQTHNCRVSVLYK